MDVFDFLLPLLTFFSIFLGFCYIEHSKRVAAEAPSFAFAYSLVGYAFILVSVSGAFLLVIHGGLQVLCCSGSWTFCESAALGNSSDVSADFSVVSSIKTG